MHGNRQTSHRPSLSKTIFRSFFILSVVFGLSKRGNAGRMVHVEIHFKIQFKNSANVFSETSHTQKRALPNQANHSYMQENVFQLEPFFKNDREKDSKLCGQIVSARFNSEILVHTHISSHVSSDPFGIARPICMRCSKVVRKRSKSDDQVLMPQWAQYLSAES